TIEGELLQDNLHRHIYATDASVYRELPLAVFYPKTKEDIKRVILFAAENEIGIIPRTAGTSLAGQCVGSGIVVDVSRYFNEVLEIDVENKIAIVQPGVIRDDLNRMLLEYGLFFGPKDRKSVV